MSAADRHGRARLAVVASAVVLATAWLAAATTTPGYRPFADTVSWLASPGQPHRWLLSTGLVASGLLVVAGAPAVAGQASSTGRGLVVLVRIYGLAAVVAGLLPKDLPGAPHTRASQVHVGATVAGGGALLAAMLLVARSSPSAAIAVASGVVAGLSAAGVLGFRLSWGTGVHGLFELVLLALATGWLVALAVVRPPPDPVRGPVGGVVTSSGTGALDDGPPTEEH